MTLQQRDDYREMRDWIARRANSEAAAVAIFAGAGVWPAGAREITEGLEREHAACYVGDQRMLTDEGLARFQTLIIPGGWAPLQQDAMGPEGLRAIERFVERGGTCIGVCAGAYLLSRDVVWNGERFPYPLGLFDGAAVGPRNNYPEPSSAEVTFTGAGVAAGYPAKATYYFNGGSSFRGGTDVTVLGRYADGSPAMISRPIGKGRIVLLGFHPEHALAGTTPAATDFYKLLLHKN